MKKVLKPILYIILFITMLMIICVSVFAHSGKTDSNGGHKDNKNISGLGGYHYHCGGYPAHLHTEGYCPYKDSFTSQTNATSEEAPLREGEKESVSASVYFENAGTKGVTSTKDNNSNPIGGIIVIFVTGITSFILIKRKKRHNNTK